MEDGIPMEDGNEAAEADVPALPPKMRRKPQIRDIGPGKIYADAAAFNADKKAWDDEHAARQLLIKQRERALDRKWDRSGRQASAEEWRAEQRGCRANRKSAAQS